MDVTMETVVDVVEITMLVRSCCGGGEEGNAEIEEACE